NFGGRRRLVLVHRRAAEAPCSPISWERGGSLPIEVSHMIDKSELIDRCNDLLSDKEQKGLANSFGRKTAALDLYSRLGLVSSPSDIEEIVLLIKLAKLAGLRDAVLSHC